MNPLPVVASGGQKPFRERVSGLPKAFIKAIFLISTFYKLLSKSARPG
jgi:hypothetical protein